MPDGLTRIFAGLRRGVSGAETELFERVYADLHRIAAAYMKRERQDHTLQATALVDEAYIQLARRRDIDWESRAHFIGMAAQTMRRLLVDHARTKRATKRGGLAKRVDFDAGAAVAVSDCAEQVVAISAALERLLSLDERQGKVVELRFFGGLTTEETAAVLDISPETVKRDWRLAKAFLKQQLSSASHQEH
jgi:RNA polymerase sigma-70 factor (ECF subfamily)